jgi:serralysin
MFCGAASISPPQNTNANKNIKAKDFMSTFGVNIHFGQNNYRNLQAVADALCKIGFSRVRCDCKDASDVADWKALAAKTKPYFPDGLKADVLITGYLNAPAVTLTSQERVIPQIAPILESIEGPNEINNYFVGHGTHGPFDLSDQTQNYAANSLAWAKALWTWKSNSKPLAGVLLFAPTIASGLPEEYAKLPDISPYVSAGSIHFYAGNGRPPSNFGGGNFSALCDWYHAAATPARPLALTECGQTTAGRPGQGGCAEATQAEYILNQMCDSIAKGVHRAYLYQLMDDTSDGDPTGSGGAESHFGIFDYQWRAKPAALALANVNALLRDRTTRFAAVVPAYSITGVTHAGIAGSSFSVSKSDGSTFIIVWNEPQIWDQKLNTPIAPPADSVTVRFGKNSAYKVYNPLADSAPFASGHSPQVTVNITGSPIFIQIRPLRRTAGHSR